MIKSFYNSSLSFFALFGSMSTLICCALPALLVTLGMGTALGSLVSAAPWLVTLTEYKGSLFCISGALLVLSTFIQWRARHMACPIDKKQARACGRFRKVSIWILSFSWIIYFIGFFFAFLAAA